VEFLTGAERIVMIDGITVTLLYQIKPDAVDDFCAKIPGLLEDTRKFKGFRDIKVLRHLDDPGKVIFIEQWDSAEDYRAYLDWRRQTGISENTDAILAGPRVLDLWGKRVA
jgi:quinol monooxygenase YgiN